MPRNYTGFSTVSFLYLAQAHHNGELNKEQISSYLLTEERAGQISRVQDIRSLTVAADSNLDKVHEVMINARLLPDQKLEFCH